MTQLHQDEPCFITDGPPSRDLPIPPHPTMNPLQISAGLTDDGGFTSAQSLVDSKGHCAFEAALRCPSPCTGTDGFQAHGPARQFPSARRTRRR